MLDNRAEKQNKEECRRRANCEGGANGDDEEENKKGERAEEG